MEYQGYHTQPTIKNMKKSQKTQKSLLLVRGRIVSKKKIKMNLSKIIKKILNQQ